MDGYAYQYSDGSRQYGDSYAFVYINATTGEQHIKEYAVKKGGPDINNINRIETIGILVALHWIKENRMDILDTQGIQLFSDSANALYDIQAIKDGATPINYDWPRVLGIRKVFLNHPKLLCCNIDAYEGFYGNELADHHAKRSSNDVNSPVHPLEYLIPEPK